MAGQTGIFKRIWRNTDNNTKWIQTVALVVGAGWTFVLWRIGGAAGGFRFIDVPELERRPPLADLSPSSSSLIGHYAPKSDFHDAFSWEFYGPPSDDLFLAEIEIFNKSGDSLGHASAWDGRKCWHAPG